jgi:hypothetical protein
MNSSTSLCKHVWPHRCFSPGRGLQCEFHPDKRNSPLCSWETNQWFVCFFSVPQMSHDIACRINGFPQFAQSFRGFKSFRSFFPVPA